MWSVKGPDTCGFMEVSAAAPQVSHVHHIWVRRPRVPAAAGQASACLLSGRCINTWTCRCCAHCDRRGGWETPTWSHWGCSPSAVSICSAYTYKPVFRQSRFTCGIYSLGVRHCFLKYKQQHFVLTLTKVWGGIFASQLENKEIWSKVWQQTAQGNNNKKRIIELFRTENLH